MANPVFNFVCNPADDYPESSTQISFGRGYHFASAPRGPDQIITRVNFPQGLWWMEDPTTRVISATANPTLNMEALRLFYEDVRMYKVFEYAHPIRGTLRYRFFKPLSIPKLMNQPGIFAGIGGFRAHQTEAFELQWIMQG